MFQNIFTMLPEISLLICLGVMALVARYRTSQTAKTFFTISKIFLFISLLSTVIFYNKSAVSDMWVNSSYTTLFKVIIYLLSLAWFFLSCKWYLNKDYSAYSFYSLGMLSILLLTLAISAINLFVLLGVVPLLGLLNYYLILQNKKEDENIQRQAKMYLGLVFFFSILMLFGCVWLYQQTNSLAYEAIYKLYEYGNYGAWDLLAAALIITPLLFMLAVAPFHSWFVDVIGGAILPVSGYLTFIPVFAYSCVLINIILHAFYPLYALLQPALIILAFLSIFMGAISANGEKNIRRLFAYSSVYQVGFMLVTILTFNYHSVLSAFVYLCVYAFAMIGIYSVFLGLKANGEYLDELADISGLAKAKPYVSAAFLVFIISLIGSPPMLGFLGKLSVINNLVIEGRWYTMLAVSGSLLLIANAYLQVIRTIYFEPGVKRFDRVDQGIYICLFINLIVVVISILNPSFLLHDAEQILRRAF